LNTSDIEIKNTVNTSYRAIQNLKNTSDFGVLFKYKNIVFIGNKIILA